MSRKTCRTGRFSWQGHPSAQDSGVYLVRPACDVAPSIWRRLTLDPGLNHHLPTLQLHHTLVLSWAVLGAEDTAAGAASGSGPGELCGAPSTVPGCLLEIESQGVPSCCG